MISEDDIKAATTARAEAATMFKGVAARWHRLIRQAFQEGELDGPTIAAAAGITKQRAYQIRDGKR